MYNEKRGVIVTFIIGIIMISVIFVSAWSPLDWFKVGENKNLEGELGATAKAQVNVTGSASPPQVVYVSLPSNGAGIIDLNLGPVFSEFNFSFLVNQTGGVANLPGINPGDIVTSYVISNFTNDASKISRPVAWCAYVGSVAWAGASAKNYTCNVTMQFFDDPGVAWNISVAISDNSFGYSLVNKSRNFTLPRVNGMIVNPQSVNWSNVKIGDTNTLSDSTPVRILNIGNIDTIQQGNSRHYIQINATGLQGQTFPAEYLGATNFSAAEASPCTASRFLEYNWRNLTLTTNHSLSTPGTPNYTTLQFCLREVQNVQPQIFRTVNDWVVQNYYF